MAKAKFDFKSIEVPAAAQKPLYAGVGAGDLAVTAVKEYVADVQKKLTGVQKDVEKTISDFDPKSLRTSALSAAKARREAVEARVAELQADAKALPTKVQTEVNDYVATVTTTVVGTYGDLAKRGEAVVRGTKLPSSATVEVKVNPTKPAAKKAPVKKPAVKKAPPPRRPPPRRRPRPPRRLEEPTATSSPRCSELTREPSAPPEHHRCLSAASPGRPPQV